MPIPREQFDKGLGPVILEFLQSHRDKAFSLPEIAAALAQAKAIPPPQDPLSHLAASIEIITTLNELFSKGLVVSRPLGGITYYAIVMSSSNR